MNSRYVVFPGPEKVEVQEETIAPPGPGQVLCAAQKSLISIGTETYCLQGVFDPGTNWAAWVQYPFRPGYSMAARVVAVGEGVAGLREGKRVSTWATHQQFFKARPDDLIPIPEAISDEEATWAALACTAQLGVRRAELRLGERVGVVGLGMLGQLVVQYLALMGARQIVAIDRVPGRLDVARAHGATHALATDVEEARPRVAEITAGRMLDAVLDVTGNPAALAPSIQLLRRLGRVVLLGDTPTPSRQCLGPGVVSGSIAILGIHGSMSPAQPSAFNPWTREEMAALFFDLLMEGRMRVSDLITDRRSPRDAPQVYARLLRDRYPMIGVIFDWSLI